MEASRFSKNLYLNYRGWYRNVDDVCPTSLEYDSDDVRKRLLNKAVKFLKNKKEYLDKIRVCFQFEIDEEEDEDYERLSPCCQDAVDSGYNYCPDCGEDLQDFKDRQRGIYNSFEDSLMLDKHIIDEEDFEQAYIDLYDEYDDYFDEISVWSNLYMEAELFKQCEEELYKEGIEIR